MRAGRLDRRISIQRQGAPTDDGYQNLPGAWEELIEVWAEVKPAPGIERLQSAENAATAPSTFRIRWSSEVADVNPKDRIGYGGRDWDIKSINEIGRRDGLEIVAMARAD